MISNLTRNEAFTLAKMTGNSVPWHEDTVRLLEALGLIEFKLEKSLQGQINEAIWDNLWPLFPPEGKIAPMDIVNALEKAGLTIVKT